VIVVPWFNVRIRVAPLAHWSTSRVIFAARAGTLDALLQQKGLEEL
jgi:hypothetical protein